jgi:ABC-type uncharacterized transport system substrate-binding protein
MLAFSQTDNNKILIIIPNQMEPYTGIVNNIQKELVEKKWSGKINVLNLKDLSYSTEKLLKGNRLIIPVGTKSVDYYLRKGLNTPFLASFITESAFSTVSKNVNRQNKRIHHFIGGISLEQPVHRLALLAKLIGTNIKSVGVVLGPNTIGKRYDLQKQIAKIGGVLHVADIKSYDNPLKKLRNIFQNSQVVIVVPDKAEFNRKLARWIITLSYKYKVPVISYSKKYADAGALISLYSQEKEIGKQTAELALAYINNHWSSSQLVAPKYFQIHINQSVNKALGLNLPPNEVLIKKLYSAEP